MIDWYGDKSVRVQQCVEQKQSGIGLGTGQAAPAVEGQKKRNSHPIIVVHPYLLSV